MFIGNVWRFPFLVYKNGGGTFLVPYLFMLLFIGMPMYFMELALGQYSGSGPTRLFGRMAPLFKGLGFAMVAVSSIGKGELFLESHQKIFNVLPGNCL